MTGSAALATVLVGAASTPARPAAAGVLIERRSWTGQVHVRPALTPLIPEGERALPSAARLIGDRTTDAGHHRDHTDLKDGR